jgi:hypothetical protein
VAINRDHGESLLWDERFRPGHYKGSLYKTFSTGLHLSI